MTISKSGITHFINQEATFYTIPQWLREYHLYQKLKKIPFFMKYKKWKNFSLWKTFCRRTMMELRKEFLNKELFILNSKLRAPLLAVRGLSFQVSRWELIDIISDEVRTLDNFNDDQEEKRFETSEELQKLERKIKDIVIKACDKS